VSGALSGVASVEVAGGAGDVENAMWSTLAAVRKGEATPLTGIVGPQG
jgi:hypothetical protein